METLIMHPKNKEQSAALKAVAKALKIDYKTEAGETNGTEKAAKFYSKDVIETI
jgi:hypothetical protein